MKWEKVNEKTTFPKDQSILVKLLGDCDVYITKWDKSLNGFFISEFSDANRTDIFHEREFGWFMLFQNQPERSKREGSDCCKNFEKLHRLRDIIIEANQIDCGEWYNDYADTVDIFNDLCEQSEMRCSEHGG